MIPLQYGSVKEARYVFSAEQCLKSDQLTLCCRFVLNAPHMGEPFVGSVILEWIENLFGVGKLPKMNGHA